MSYYCPKCQGVVYNRRIKLCGFCGAELPVELLFTEAEMKALDKEAVESEERYERRTAQEAAEAEERRAAETVPLPPAVG